MYKFHVICIIYILKPLLCGLFRLFKRRTIKIPNMERFLCVLLIRSKLMPLVCVLQAGLIRVSQEEYLIAPLPQHLAEEHNYRAPDGHHPHVIYKRSAEHVVHRRSSGASPSRPVNPYLQHHRHHQQLHQQQQQHHHDDQHAKLQRQHFCGRRKQCM